MSSLKERIEHEFENAVKMQDSALQCTNLDEVKGMLRVGMLPNILRIVEQVGKELHGIVDYGYPKPKRIREVVNRWFPNEQR